MDALIEKILQKDNPTVAGLDPRQAHLPPELREMPPDEAYLKFNLGLIDALADVVPAVKPQAACYEALGAAGMAVLEKTIAAAREAGLYVISDAKRGDIGSTAEAYAEAWLADGPLGSDAVTVNPYLGSDGILPFLATGRDVFALVKTSNPSSAELQDLDCGGEPLYMRVAKLVEKLGAESVGEHGYSKLGAVVGATHPAELAQLRAAFPTVFFLVPGYGAQGGGAADVAGAFDEKGLGAIINSSRGIIAAWKKTGGDWRDAARSEAIAMREALRAAGK
ncbi:MAG: orotidine-5'-phosphate decarboxylase [Oscillospiraceae bacterium]|nr:orotidine-5'-phosphate decarboxylase [Oscillospiraceae bacterium]